MYTLLLVSMFEKSTTFLFLTCYHYHLLAIMIMKLIQLKLNKPVMVTIQANLGLDR
nr:MAG TPA: hypothetical protein [Caudoviricetes sp.]